MHESAKSNAKVFVDMLARCLMGGRSLAPRGLKILELEDFQIGVSPRYPFMSFEQRNYDVNYFKKEMLWKLGADKFDESIKQHAAMWSSVQNPDGSFNSNYGQYWFGEQNGFWHVVTELAKDADSRQAVIPMLNASHMTPETVDKVCTLGVGFRIRDNHLNMSVQMRSSDQIFGLGTDIPTFSFLYRMVLGALHQTYPNLCVGQLSITAMSSHIYQRHFDMVSRILAEGPNSYRAVEMPMCSGMAEAMFLVSTKGKYDKAPAEYLLANWLIQGE